jgi:hypothetical protein
MVGTKFWGVVPRDLSFLTHFLLNPCFQRESKRRTVVLLNLSLPHTPHTTSMEPRTRRLSVRQQALKSGIGFVRLSENAKNREAEWREKQEDWVEEEKRYKLLVQILTEESAALKSVAPPPLQFRILIDARLEFKFPDFGTNSRRYIKLTTNERGLERIGMPPSRLSAKSRRRRNCSTYESREYYKIKNEYLVKATGARAQAFDYLLYAPRLDRLDKKSESLDGDCSFGRVDTCRFPEI